MSRGLFMELFSLPVDSLCDQLLAALIYLHFIILILLICFSLITPGVDYAIYVAPLFQRTLFLLPPFFRKYLNPQIIRINKMVKQCKYHPCLSRLASRIQYYKVGNIFEFTVFIFLENALNLGVFYS